MIYIEHDGKIAFFLDEIAHPIYWEFRTGFKSITIKSFFFSFQSQYIKISLRYGNQTIGLLHYFLFILMWIEVGRIILIIFNSWKKSWYGYCRIYKISIFHKSSFRYFHFINNSGWHNSWKISQSLILTLDSNCFSSTLHNI